MTATHHSRHRDYRADTRAAHPQAPATAGAAAGLHADLIGPAVAQLARQARPARRGPQPGDVRGRGRQRRSRPSPSSPPRHRAAARAPLFVGLVSGWLWFTVLFANFAEAMAEGRGKAQADTLRKTKTETLANVEVDGAISQIAGQRAAQGRRRAWSRPARRSPATATSSRASPPWTSRPSPASPPRSSARAAATAAPSPAARACSPTRSRCGSPPTPARRSSTA